jgi:hypothetical protein
MALNPDVIETVEATNQAVTGQSADFYLNIALSDAVSHQRRMNVLLEAATSRIVKKLDDTPVQESIAAVKELAASVDLSGQIKNFADAFIEVQQKLKATV